MPYAVASLDISGGAVGAAVGVCVCGGDGRRDLSTGLLVWAATCDVDRGRVGLFGGGSSGVGRGASGASDGASDGGSDGVHGGGRSGVGSGASGARCGASDGGSEGGSDCVSQGARGASDGGSDADSNCGLYTYRS